MDERFGTFTENDDGWFSDMELRVHDLEEELSEWRESRAREPAGPGRGHGRKVDEPAAGRPRKRPSPAAGYAWPVQDGGRRPTRDRTRVLIDRGRRTARQPRVRRARRGRSIVIASAAGLVLVIVCAVALSRTGASWPPSVAAIKSEIAAACQDPDVVSEPGQVGFACGKDTSQVLWVFSLMTSGGNPGYSDARTGRKGLEPITPAQGGQIAWSLNLHHPYNPLDPADSLAVAARAIDNIIGGATLTGPDGRPSVQPGLEGKPQNCARYTGSPAIVSHPGFPSLCASPVTSPAGRAALVADVYQQWMVGATPVAAQDAAVLFQNADNPGDPQVQAILKALPNSGR